MNGMKEADGCVEKHWRGRRVMAAPVGSDVGSFSLKECRDVSFAGALRAHVGWSCPHLLHLSHWRQSGRWGRRRGRGTKRG